ncbi:MAG: peptide chain release factor N(5)-glutamine methyltransferase [Planctomycetota bacterium]
MTAETTRSVLKLAAEWLEKKGADAPRLDAELLLASVLKKKRLDLYLDHDRPLTEGELEPFRALLRRRAAREPIAYILGEREFFGLAFEVTRDVLVPRPDTEHLVVVAQEAVDKGAKVFADVGTGSGCVAISLMKHRDGLQGFATDTSSAALAVAKKNVEKHGVVGLELVECDLLEKVPGPLDLIVSNPPYVLPSEKGSLEPELSFEPASALFDTAEDLPTTRRLAEQARERLATGGTLAVETGAKTGELVRAILARAGFSEVRAVKDLDGHERVIVGRNPHPAT